jgi:hypothetical protein
LISSAVWRWIRVTIKHESPQSWYNLAEIRSWISLLAAFKDWMSDKTISGAPSYKASDLPSVARFGYWLFSRGELYEYHQIVPIIWGLAFIGAAWDMQFRCDRCQICFRRARPGEAHCDFHSQSTAIDIPRSEAFQQYRRGLRARELILKEPLVADFMFGSHMQLHVERRLALPDILFPLVPIGDDWPDEHGNLISILEISSRVVAAAGVEQFRTMPHEMLVECLRKKIDPYNWSNDLWDVRVNQAERWLEFEEKVSPGIRGKGRITSAMVSSAIDLVTSGYSKGQIAAMLGVTPSAISQWVRRYPDFRSCLNKRSINNSTA